MRKLYPAANEKTNSCAPGTTYVEEQDVSLIAPAKELYRRLEEEKENFYRMKEKTCNLICDRSFPRLITLDN
jgi:hypothetical protein